MSSNNYLAIDQAQGLRQPNATQVIAVTAGKGGVGKTNVSVNLAMALAKQGKRVIVLDADFGLANVDVMLGLYPKHNLSHVLNGECDLQDIIISGPCGINIIPAASGLSSMAKLSTLQQNGLICAFETLSKDIDMLIIDTAAGIGDSVVSFVKAAQEVMVVVCDEPTSITDAYAMIKILSRDHDIHKFHVVANMVGNQSEGRILYNKLCRVADQFLSVSLNYMGAIPFDECLRKAVKQQKAVLEAYPGSKAADNLRKIANNVMDLPVNQELSGNTSFFINQLLQRECV